MMKPEEKIENKLKELESSLQEKSASTQENNAKSDIGSVGNDDFEADTYLTIGFASLLLAVLLFFHHVHVGTVAMASFFGWGQAGFGFTIIPLLAGIGLLLYDYKKRIGWVITSASCALIIFAVLSQLVMTFTPTSLLGLTIMLLPLAIGAALIAKGIAYKRNNSDK